MPRRSILFLSIGLLVSIVAATAFAVAVPLQPLLIVALVPTAFAIWQIQHRLRLSIDAAVLALFDGHAFPAPQTGVLPRTAFA